MVSSNTTKDGMSESKVYPCVVCSLRVKANSVLCVWCYLWVHGGCSLVKRVTPNIYRSFTCRKYEGNIGETVEQEVKLYDEMETVWEFTYLGVRESAGGGCVAAVTARTRCGWVRLRECGELLYGRRFPLSMKGAVYMSCIRPAILNGSEAWCLK